MPSKILQSLRTYFLNSKPVQASKRIALPGFDGIPIYNVAEFFIEGIKKGYINTRAYALSFQFFLALFPALIFLFTLLPFIPIENFQNQLLSLLTDLMPSNVYEMTQNTLQDLLLNQRGGLLSFGFLVTIYLATNGIDAMFSAFNESVHVKDKSDFFVRKSRALLTLVILLILVIVAIGSVVFAEIVMTEYLADHDDITYWLLEIGQWLVIVALFFFAYSFIYYLGSSKRYRWRLISAGSSLATTLSLALSVGFSYYVNNFGQYNKLYGSIGTLIVVLLWIYFNSLVLLIGYELNVSIKQAQRPRE